MKTVTSGLSEPGYEKVTNFMSEPSKEKVTNFKSEYFNRRDNMKTILTVKDLCERWGVDARTIARYEEEGIIRRLSKIPGVRFSLTSIEKLEYDGTDNLLMRKDQIIREQNLRIQELESKLKMIREVAI